jgi:predicted N-acetyltransferase YhbS
MIIDAPTAAHREALRALWQEAFGDTDEFLDSFENAAFSPDRCRCISEGDEILAALYWFDCSLHGHRLAYLYAVATSEKHRGHGLCRTLMENTHAHLAALGYAAALLVPGEPSLFDFYEKLGYRICTHVDERSCTASNTGTDVREIGAEEYAALRRDLLPPNSVLQEKENLAFLAETASFYAGDRFLLAAERKGELLRGLEILGDTERAPSILVALGCKEGTFRTPGNQKPFAMCYPLGKDTLPSPLYFGLAFD